MFGKIKTYRTKYGSCSQPDYEGQPYEIENRPVGEIRTIQGVDCQFEVQDAERIWSDGQVDRISGYYKTIVSDRKSDFCGYCGADNGSHSQYRQGWNCWYCGGN